MQVERAHEGGLQGTSALPVASGAGARTPRHDAEVTESTWARLLCPGDTRHARGDSKERRPFCSASGSPSSGEISCRRGGEGSGPRAEPYKPQRLRRAVCPCLAFLPAAADTLLPTRPAGPRPLSALSSIHCVSLYVRSLRLSVCLSLGVGRPPPALGCHYLVSGRVSSLLWARHTQPRVGCKEVLVRSDPPPARPGDHTPPTLPFPHFCLRSQLPAHQPVTGHSPLLITSRQGMAAGL